MWVQTIHRRGEHQCGQGVTVLTHGLPLWDGAPPFWLPVSVLLTSGTGVCQRKDTPEPHGDLRNCFSNKALTFPAYAHLKFGGHLTFWLVPLSSPRLSSPICPSGIQLPDRRYSVCKSFHNPTPVHTQTAHSNSSPISCVHFACRTGALMQAHRDTHGTANRGHSSLDAEDPEDLQGLCGNKGLQGNPKDFLFRRYLWAPSWGYCLCTRRWN